MEDNSLENTDVKEINTVGLWVELGENFLPPGSYFYVRGLPLD